MLLLTRKVGESIIIDGGQIRLGVDAPKEVKVYREEIYERLPDYVAPPYG